MTDPHWNVFRVFSVKGMVATQEARCKDPNENKILRRLKEQREKLVSSESGLEPKLRSLLKGTIDERKALEDPDVYTLRVSRNKTLNYQFVLERHREAYRIWQQQLEQDMTAVICMGLDAGSWKNALCNLGQAVEIQAFKLRQDPERVKWFLPIRAVVALARGAGGAFESLLGVLGYCRVVLSACLFRGLLHGCKGRQWDAGNAKDGHERDCVSVYLQNFDGGAALRVGG